MFIIFLDIDGVIFHPAVRDHDLFPHLERNYTKIKIDLGLGLSREGYHRYTFDQAAVDLFDKGALKLLNQFVKCIEENGEHVGIVISSSWREKYSIPQLQELFKQHDFSKKIIDKTANRIEVMEVEIDFYRILNRGEEIDLWLQKNRAQLNISNFLIFDDVDDGISELFKKNFVHCRNGLFNQQDLENAYSKFQHAFSFTCIHPFNRLRLTIHGEAGSKSTTEEALRLTTDKRRNFLACFFKKRTSLSGKIADLITEYDHQLTRR